MPYTHEHGSYYLRSESGHSIRLMCDQVAIAFAEKDLTVLKHGRPEDIQAWWKERRHEAEPLFGPVSIATFPRRFPVEELNKIIFDFRRLDASSLIKAELENGR
jgi:hypothetical protein